jgi:hypothetical protein
MARQLQSQYGDADNCVRAMKAGVGGSWAAPTLICSGNFVSNDVDGFTISWAVGATQNTSVLYISLGDVLIESVLKTRTVLGVGG